MMIYVDFVEKKMSISPTKNLSIFVQMHEPHGHGYVDNNRLYVTYKKRRLEIDPMARKHAYMRELPRYTCGQVEAEFGHTSGWVFVESSRAKAGRCLSANCARVPCWILKTKTVSRKSISQLELQVFSTYLYVIIGRRKIRVPWRWHEFAESDIAVQAT